MAIGNDIIEAAKAELGVKEEPNGSNRGKRVQEYQALTWLPGTGWPWCVAFAWEFVVWSKALKKPCPYQTASVAQLEAWARSNGWATAKPALGDLCCMNNGQHVTIYAGPNGPGWFRALGGNQNHSVSYTSYKLADVTTVVRVPKSLRPTPPAKKPRYEVVKGQGEKAKVIFTGPAGKAMNKAGNAIRAGAKVVRIRKRP